jgi:hypothetical protein
MTWPTGAICSPRRPDDDALGYEAGMPVGREGVCRVGQMPQVPPEPGQPESRERHCPSCQSERIVHAGRVITTGGMIRAEHRCEACGTAFVFVRKRVA